MVNKHIFVGFMGADPPPGSAPNYDYIESNHDYNCLDTSSERKQYPFA